MIDCTAPQGLQNKLYSHFFFLLCSALYGPVMYGPLEGNLFV